jgi:hypothetical protein
MHRGCTMVAQPRCGYLCRMLQRPPSSQPADKAYANATEQNRTGGGDGGLFKEKGGLHREVRLGRVTFGKEEVERIVLAGGQAESVQTDCGRLHAMDSAEVDHQLVIDEDEDVVVTGEAEGLTRLIGKLRVKLQREMIVVDPALIAQKLVVDREEGWIRILIDSSSHVGKDQVIGCAEVDASNIVVPLVEVGGPAGGDCPQSANVHRFVVRAERRVDKPSVIGYCALEIGVRRVEIPQGSCQGDIRLCCRGSPQNSSQQ